MIILETLQHVLPYLKDVCDSYEAADQLRQLPVLLERPSRFRAVDLPQLFCQRPPL